VGQGALAITALASRPDLLALAMTLEHTPTRIRILAERAFLVRLRGGCQVPAGALAEISVEGGRARGLRIQGAIASLDGSRCIRDETVGHAEESLALGSRLAEGLLAKGGAEILERLRGAGGLGSVGGPAGVE
jgi:hydroxymethylbilane synthase